MSDPTQTTKTDDIDLLTPGEEEKLLEGADDPTLPAPVPPVSISFEPDTSADDSTVGSSLSAVEGIIRRQSGRLDELKEQARVLSDQLRSIQANDEELSKAEEEVKIAARKQKERKTALANTAESMQIKYKLKELKESIKDIEESLSNHLLNLFQITGVKEFDTDDGNKREYDVRAKLRGKKRQDS